MILGLSFALVCALVTNLSSLFKARGAVLARPIQVRHPLRSATDLFRQRWFAVGWILALFAWGLHIEAIALAPLSSVHAVLSGGLVFLAVLAERFSSPYSLSGSSDFTSEDVNGPVWRSPPQDLR
jgi:hypothetical protein